MEVFPFSFPELQSFWSAPRISGFLHSSGKISCDVLLYPRAWELGFLLGSIMNGFRSHVNKIINGHKRKNVIF